MKKIRADYAYSTDSLCSVSCEFTLNDDIIKRLLDAKKILDDNDFIDIVTVYVSLDITQFDSTLDDTDNKEVSYQDDCYFRSDTQMIKIFNHGMYLRCLGKYDSSQYFEVGVEL